MGCPNVYYKQLLKNFVYYCYKDKYNNVDDIKELEKLVLNEKEKLSCAEFYYGAGRTVEHTLIMADMEDNIDGFNACCEAIEKFEEMITIEKEVKSS